MPEASSGAQYGALFALVVFIAASVWLGTLAQRVVEKGSFLKGYFLGNRGLGVWALALTATVQSGGTFMGFPGYVYAYGWVGALFIASYMVVPLTGFAIIGKRIAQISRKTGAITIPDLFRDRFGSPTLGLVSSLIILVFMTTMMIGQFKAGAIVMKLALAGAIPASEDATDYDTAFYVGLGVFALTVVGYTMIGGFLAAVWTDLFQSVMMFIGVLILLGLSLYAAGGMESATRRAMESRAGPAIAEQQTNKSSPAKDSATDKKSPTGTQIEWSKEGETARAPGYEHRTDAKGETTDIPWLTLGGAISFFVLWPFSGLASPASVVRVMAVKDTDTLRRSIPVLCLYNMCIYLPIIMVAICARAVLPPLAVSDEAIPRMTFHVTQGIPGGSLLAGLILAAPFGAIMATVSSYLVVIASGVVRDIYQRYLRPHATQNEIRNLAYVAMIVVGIVAILANIRPVDHLQKLVIFSTTNTGCAFLMPLLMLAYWRRANGTGALAAMCAGVLTVIALYGAGIVRDGDWTKLSPIRPLWFDPMIWGNLVAIAVGIAVTMLTPPPEEKLAARFFDAGAA
jgi:SSS family solute:Na+ symporter/sodium/pantothenate symporter